MKRDASTDVELSLVDLRSVPVRAVKWIEKPFLARGELHILQGHGSAGKGALTCLWAAEASRRQEHVVMVVAEDDLGAQIKPRLTAAGAELEYVRVLGVKRHGFEDALLIPDDLAFLEKLIAERDARLVTIDPLLTHVVGKTDSYKDHDVKRVLTPLSKLAQRTGCTIVAVHHFKKDTSQGARHSGQASTAFTTTARITLSMAKADDGVHVLEVSKSNIGPEGDGQAFRAQIVEIAADDGDTAEVPLLERDGAAAQTVDEILSAPKRESRSARARDLIVAVLSNVSEMASDELDARVAREIGLAERTIRNLRMELGKEGVLRSVPVHEDGAVKRWYVALANRSAKSSSPLRDSEVGRDSRDSGALEPLDALPSPASPAHEGAS